MKNSFVILIIITTLAVALTLILFILPAKNRGVSDFAECAAAGYPVTQSYPRICEGPDGRTFTEPVSEPGGTGSSDGSGPGVACTMDAKLCPDGSSVGRVPPDCEFSPCPGE